MAAPGSLEHSILFRCISQSEVGRIPPPPRLERIEPAGNPPVAGMDRRQISQTAHFDSGNNPHSLPNANPDGGEAVNSLEFIEQTHPFFQTTNSEPACELRKKTWKFNSTRSPSDFTKCMDGYAGFAASLGCVDPKFQNQNFEPVNPKKSAATIIRPKRPNSLNDNELSTFSVKSMGSPDL